MTDPNQPDHPDELDFSVVLNPGTHVPEPVHTPEELRHIDDLGSIGASALKDQGFYARIVSAQSRPAGKSPADTTVIVVEDDEGTATIIRRSLEKFEYRTRVARDLVSIASALRKSPLPDLILLDVMLPDINGFDVLNRIRQNAVLKSVPVIMLTSLSERSDIARGLGLGADAYLSKPVLPSTLLDAVQAVLGG